MSNGPTYLGSVQDVQGATISVVLDDNTVSGLVFIEGRGYRIGQVGSFVRVPIGLTDLFGIVSQVGAGAVPEALVTVEPYGRRWLRVQLIGESQRGGEFRRGISLYPTINDEAHLVTEHDLGRIYGRADAPYCVRIGSVASAESIPALVDINRLVTRHSAVLGSTGAGKSTTVANLLASLSDPQRYPSSRVIVFDIHGEYSAALKDRATVFRVNPPQDSHEERLVVPYWALSFDELLSVTPFHSVSDTDRAALVERVKALKVASLQTLPRKGVTVDTMTVDTPVPFSIHRLWYELYREVCSTHTTQGVNQGSGTEAIERGPDGQQLLGDIMTVRPPKYQRITTGGPNRVYLSGSTLNIRRQILATQALLRDTRYDFLFRPGPWCPSANAAAPNAQPKKDIDDLLKLWIGGDQPISILDLSGIPASILMHLIGVLLRLLFDALFWARRLPEGGRDRPLLVVLEEAHAYLQAGKEGPSGGWYPENCKGRSQVRFGCDDRQPTAIRNRSDDSIAVWKHVCNEAIECERQIARYPGRVSDNLEGLFDMLPALRTGGGHRRR